MDMDDAFFGQLLKQTRVLEAKDPSQWHWPSVLEMVTNSSSFTVARLQLTQTARMVKRVLSFFRPTARTFVDEPRDGDVSFPALPHHLVAAPEPGRLVRPQPAASSLKAAPSAAPGACWREV